MNHLELANHLRNDMFAERDTIREAYEYAMLIARASGSSPQVTTAIHVLMNTIAKSIEQIEQPSV